MEVGSISCSNASTVEISSHMQTKSLQTRSVPQSNTLHYDACQCWSHTLECL